MALKLEERGRGKFKPAPDYTIDEVRNLLLEKIEEETQLSIDEPLGYDMNDLIYKNDKANILGLFCGAGGLDLGIELAGLDVIIGEEKTNEIFKSKESFNTNREKG